MSRGRGRGFGGQGRADGPGAPGAAESLVERSNGATKREWIRGSGEEIGLGDSGRDMWRIERKCPTFFQFHTCVVQTCCSKYKCKVGVQFSFASDWVWGPVAVPCLGGQPKMSEKIRSCGKHAKERERERDPSLTEPRTKTAAGCTVIS